MSRDTRTVVLILVATLTVAPIPIVVDQLSSGPREEIEETVMGFLDDLAQDDVAGACDKLSAHGRTLVLNDKSRPMGATKATCIEAAALPGPPDAELGEPEVSKVEIVGNRARVVLAPEGLEDLGYPFDSVVQLRKGDDEGWRIHTFAWGSAP
jgi:hypothetical protein